jgi:hypothetical protein
MAITHTPEQVKIQPGRVYRVRASDDVIYKALVWEALANDKYLVEFLEPFESKEAAKFELGDKDEVPAGNIISPYTFSEEDGTKQDYLAVNLSNDATAEVKELSLSIMPRYISDDSNELLDSGFYEYDLVLTDPERLGDKIIKIDVFVPIEGLRREVRTDQIRKKDPADVSCSCYYD